MTRKYYYGLDDAEKEHLTNLFVERYGEHLPKAKRVIERVKKGWEHYDVMWADINFTASKDLIYVIPYGDYVSLYRRVRGHRLNVMWSMRNDPAWGAEMVRIAMRDPNGYVNISDSRYGTLGYKDTHILNILKEASKSR